MCHPISIERCGNCKTSRVRPAVLFTLLLLTSACRPTEPQEVAATEVREVRALPGNGNSAPQLLLPNKLGSVKFAVIGDSGRGNDPQYQVAAQMVEARRHFPYDFVLMNGDNIYEGPATDADYENKFARPYASLLDAGVKFYAVLGNHDDPRQVFYAPFNMGGNRYYTFRPPTNAITQLLTSVRFFAIDTVTLDRQQIRWLDTVLRESDSEWKICFFHHPMYTSGRYQRASAAFRTVLEPIFRRNGVDAVFSGHEHFYMRSLLQGGIQYFVSGGAGSLRYDDSNRTAFMAQDFDTDYHFMLVEIERDVMSFQAISRKGATVDSGALHRRRETTTQPAPGKAQPSPGK